MKGKVKITARKRFKQKFGKEISEFDSIKRSVETLRSVTQKNYYRNLAPFFLWLGEDPDETLKQRKKDLKSEDLENSERYERKATVYINMLLERGYSGRGAKGPLSRIQGFFSNNSRRYSLDMRRLRLPKARKIQKYSPPLEEIRVLYTFADSHRDRLIVALMFQNGLSPVDVSGLKIGDLPLKEWGYYEKSRSKTGEIWHGVVTPDILFDLQKLLKVMGNPPNGEPLFVGRQGPLNNKAVSEVISKLMKKAGFNEKIGLKPTSLRDAFEDALVKSNVQSKLKELMMGHSAGMEREYGGTNALKVMIVDAAKRVYPLLTLNGYTRQSQEMLEVVKKDEFEKLSAEMEKLKVQLTHYEDFMRKAGPIIEKLDKESQEEGK